MNTKDYYVYERITNLVTHKFKNYSDKFNVKLISSQAKRIQ